MRVGLVCPYSFDVPGGVQAHVRDLAAHLGAAGHHVSVLAPAEDGAELPPFVVSAGRAVPVPYNGSVSRLRFGPVAAARVARWLDDGGFDVCHLHEPLAPSTSLLALWAATCPVVATFHTANLRSRAMQAAYPLLRPSLEKIAARIAVSEDARRTVVEHIGGDAVVVPNGVDTRRFATAAPRPEWTGTPGAPVLALLGRLDEPRKGLHVLCAALPRLRAAVPGVRVLVAGHGAAEPVRALAPADAAAVELLGPLDEPAKAALLRSADVYVAPHTGAESFGIVLVEAMSAGTAVAASDLGAFRRVLGDGEHGRLFTPGDPAALAGAVLELLADPAARAGLARAGQLAARTYDWAAVATDVLRVYETVTAGRRA
ncbi:phosphatidylinositol alpha-mannosyltransferase [Kineococcus xinjiangensis]|uniref:Phosphatidylinositol alpha-mannosyltransferase n=1 Tax=Kineococcus xinjiangensis TaxID=512762 RepID=A0A2S6IPD3_9ACTN|nr:glycosyltransferase family 4 protein [Kineococcus xinjiangensis]PPK95956.1 phosphatidylinositol alpha-mannosyltransferase [Kineococcus xinjiangensis]